MISYDERVAMIHTPVTLNGQPARIGGARNRFAGVAVLPDGPSYEFAWETVAHIIKTKEGRFTA
jgi:hypothetical protein